MSALGALPSGVTCRTINEDDLEGVISCLRRGFPQRSRDYWHQAFVRASQREAIDDLPRYGVTLESHGKIVGVLLTLYARYQTQHGSEIRCNLGSWAVDNEFRPYATKMILKVLKRRDITYVNISPAPATIRFNEAFGFRLFSHGQVAFAPALSSAGRACRVVEADPNAPEMAMLSDNERTILSEHAALGCYALICIDGEKAHPFVLIKRHVVRGLIPCCQVIYCRSTAELSRYAGAIGRFLLPKGIVLCLVDATEIIPGLRGRYFPNRGPKYFKGPRPPSPGDLTFTEMVVYGP